MWLPAVSLLLLSSSWHADAAPNLVYSSPIRGFDFGLGVRPPSLRRRLEAAESGDCDVKCFEFHSVASGDATSSAVIIWAKLSVVEGANPDCFKCIPLVKYTLTPNKRRKKRKGSEDSNGSGESSDSKPRGTVCGNTTTSAEANFIVKVDVDGLKAGTSYTYSFELVSADSHEVLMMSGQTKTLPKPNKHASKLDVRFATVSCQFMEAGYFLAYRDIAADDSIDFVIHFGDSIYEYGEPPNPFTGTFSWPDQPINRVPRPPHECYTLEDYRMRHEQYKSDNHSKAAFAAKPFYFVWDDHEIADGANTAGAVSHDDMLLSWSDRKKNGIQAFYEWSAVRQLNAADMFEQFRVIKYGKLVDINLLETRLTAKTINLFNLTASLLSNPQTHRILGDSQIAWLVQSVGSSKAQWKVVGSSNQIADVHPAFVSQFWNPGFRDYWVGYYTHREVVLRQLALLAPQNLMFLSGDSHLATVQQVTPKYDYFSYFVRRAQIPPQFPLNNSDTEFGEPFIGVEISSNSISSPGPDANFPPPVQQQFLTLLRLEWPELMLRLGLGKRGYTVTHVRDGLWTSVQYGYSSIQDLSAQKTVDYTGCWADGDRTLLDVTLCEP